MSHFNYKNYENTRILLKKFTLDIKIIIII